MKILSQHRSIVIAILLFAAIYIYLDYIHFGCIFQRFLHIPCPGCGMTRALKSALILDWKAAFSYHRMVFSLPLVAGYILMNGRLLKHKGLNDLILILIGVGFLGNYIIELVG
ncbi:MAG: DUF2752 domain-containing protein [Candidatus Fimivivens sp.]